MEGGQALRQRCLFHPQGEEQHGDELFEVSNFSNRVKSVILDLVRTLEGRQQELRDAQNRLAEARAEQLKQEAEVLMMLGDVGRFFARKCT